MPLLCGPVRPGMGVPGLRGDLRRQVESENRLARKLFRWARAAGAAGTGVTMIVPAGSCLLSTTEAEGLRKVGWRLGRLDLCRFGTGVQVSTCLLSNRSWLGGVDLACNCTSVHVRVRGRVLVEHVWEPASRGRCAGMVEEPRNRFVGYGWSTSSGRKMGSSDGREAQAERMMVLSEGGRKRWGRRIARRGTRR